MALKLRRIVLRTVAVLGGLILVCLLLIAFGLFPQEWLRGTVERQVRGVLGPGARIGSLHVVPGRLQAVASDVSIEGEGYRLEVDRMRIALALPTVLGRAFALRSVALEHPVLTLEPAKSDATATESTSAGLKKSVLVGDVNVTNGTIIYRDAALGGDIRVDNVTIAGGIGKSSLTLTTGKPRWERPEPLVLDPIRATLSISPTLQASIESLEIGTPRSHVTARGDLGDIVDPELNLELQMQLDLADAALVPEAPAMSGHVAGTAKLTGPAAALQANAQLQGQSLVINRQRVDRLSVTVAYKEARTQASLEAAALGGQISGKVDIKGEQIDASAKATKVDLARLAESAGTPGLTGEATITASARGRSGQRLETAVKLEAAGRSSEALAFTATAELGGALLGRRHEADVKWTASGNAEQPPSASGAPTLKTLAWSADGVANGAWPPRVNGRIQGDGRMLSPTRESPFRIDGTVTSQGETTSALLEVTGDLGRVRMTAEASPKQMSVDVTATEVRLERFVAQTSGVARFAFQGAGPRAAFRGSGQGEIVALQWRDVPMGNVAIEAKTEGNVHRASIRVPKLAITANLTLAPLRPASSDLELAAHVELRDAPLDPFAPFVDPTFKGTATATVDVKGPLATLATAAQVQARVDALTVSTERVKASLQNPLTIDASPTRVTLDDLHAAGDGFDLHVGGTFGVTAGAPMNAQVRGTANLASLPVSPDTQVEGSARLDVKLTGTRARPLATGSVDFEGLRALAPQVPEIRVEAAHIELAGDSIRIPDATATVAGGRVRLNAMVPVAALIAPAGARTDGGHLNVIWEGVDAAQIHAAAAPTAEVSVEGLLEGEAHLTARSLASPQSLNGRIRTPPLVLRIDELPVSVSGISVEIQNGQVVLSRFDVGTNQGALHVEGRADLVRRTLDASTTGSLDLRALSPFLSDAALTGRAELNLDVTGPFASPRPSGRITLADANLRMRDIQPSINDIDGAIEIGDKQLRIPGITARWGGGPVTVSGTAAIAGAQLRDVNVAIKGEDLSLRYLDTKTLVSATLTLTGRTGALLLSGDVDIKRGLYDKDIFFGESMRAAAVVQSDTSPFLSTLGLALNVQTSQPFRVANNIARLQARGRLTIRGTAQDPAPIGRFTLMERGEVILQQQKFTTVREEGGSTIQYDGSLDPTLNLQAMGKIRYRESGDKGMADMTVVAEITGRLSRPVIQFREDGGDPNADFTRRVVGILATGREDPGQGGEWIVGEQAATLLAGRLSQNLSRRLRRLGLDQVTIEPNLIAQESDPSARLTFGKNLTPWSNLIYSVGLQDTEEPFFELHVNPLQESNSRLFRNFGTYVRHGDSGETLGLTHRLRLGGGSRRARPPSDETMKIDQVRIEGTLPVEEARMRQWLGTSPSSKRTFWDLQDDAEKARRRLVELGHIEAEVAARLDGSAAVFTVRPGPHYTWRVEGMPNPADLTDVIRQALYAEEALEKGAQKLVADLRDRGHLRAAVDTQIEGDGDERALVFIVRPGAVYTAVDVVFDGAKAISQRGLLRVAGGTGELLTQAARARKRIEEQYHRDYYLTASVGVPRIEEAGSRLSIRVAVREGPRARIAGVTFSGHSLPEEELRPLAAGVTGRPPEELEAEEVLQAIRDRYFARGYPNVRASWQLLPSGTDLELRIDIAEGAPVQIREIAFEGSSRVPQSVLERELPFHVGDPLDPRKLSAGEARLSKYDARARISSDPKDPARVIIQLTPAPRLVADYSLELTQHRSPGGALSVRAPNVLMRGVTPGLSWNQSEFERTLRGWIRLPALIHSGILNLSVAQEKEVLLLTTEEPPRPGESHDESDLFHRKAFVATILQELELGNHWRLQYGYDFKRSTTTTAAIVAPFVTDRGRVQTSFLRDTRDHVLDARRGRFLSMSVAYAPEALGSDVPFVKGLAQISVYRSLNRGLTWAQSYRVGVGGDPRGGRLVPIERFDAGGSTTLRGYAQREVGPLSIAGRPESGDALVLLNQELRYHHKTGLGAAVFYDFGNVYRTVSDINLDLRHSIGAGVRYDSPIGLVRVDFGLPVNRRPTDKSYQIFLGIGQAF